MYQPKISILILLYNSGSFLRETIDSVLSQTFKDFELLLMDDSSIDNTAEIIATFIKTRAFDTNVVRTILAEHLTGACRKQEVNT